MNRDKDLDQPGKPSFRDRSRNKDDIKNLEALKSAAQVQLVHGNFEDALTVLVQIHTLCPSDLVNAVLIGDLLRELRRDEQAVAYYEKAVKMHIVNKDFGKALIIEEKIGDILTGDAAVLLRQVDLHLKLRANTQLEVAQDHESKAVKILTEMANKASESLDHDAAARYYQIIVDVDPLNAEACLRLARHLLVMNRRKDAVNHLISAAKGLLRRRMIEEAGDVIIEASKLDDNNPDIKALFFRMQLFEGYVKVGLDGLHKIHKEYPSNLEIILTLARAYVSFNQLEVSRDWFLKAFGLGASPAPLEHVARKLMDKGNPDGALLTLQPIAEKCLRDNQAGQAVKTLEIIHQQGDHQPTLELLYQIQRQEGEHDRAEYYLTCILNMYAAQERGQEGLAYLWKMMEDERESSWRNRMEVITARFVAGGRQSAVLREFPKPAPVKKTGEYSQESPLQHQSFDDLVASLPSRRLLKERLDLAMKQTKKDHQLLALILLDLDRKRWERAEMDSSVTRKALFAALQGAISCLRESDTLAYLGGDEFAILLPGINVPQNIQRIVRQVLEKASAPVEVDDLSVFLVTNIGVAIYPNDGDQSSTLLKKADVALQRSREKGKNTYALYTEQLSTITIPRRGLERDMQAAIQRGELVLHYQPIVDLRLKNTGVVGCEALIRWQHPDLGLLYPRDFMALAGETGFIIPMGLWVLEAVVAQVKTWHEAGLKTPWMTLNLTAEQCRDRAFLSGLKQTIETNQLPEGILKLGIESSEALMLDDSEETRAQLHWIRRLGVVLAIDDFGTGSTSVVNLKRSPASTIKIDGSHIKLLHDPEIAILVRGLIGLANSFSLEVVAEGVETEQQASFLHEAGCHFAQGFYFCNPLASEEMARLLDGRSLPEV